MAAAASALLLLLTLLLTATRREPGDRGVHGAPPKAAGPVVTAAAAHADVPSWWECATCLHCVVDASAVAPPPETWNTRGQCPQCWGCTHHLQMLNLTVPLPRLSVGSVRMHPGNTGASIFVATDGNGTQSVLKVHGVVTSMVSAGKMGQLRSLYKGVRYLAHELEVGHALSALAEECGLGKVSIREWLAPVRGVVPLTGEKLHEARAVLAEYARGASLEMLTIKLPSADLLRLMGALPHDRVRDAALFDLLFLQGDRHAENVFVDDDGSFQLIDSRDAAMEPGGLDSLFFASTVTFERNRVGNEHLYDSDKRPVSHHWPQNTLDYRCHVRGGAIGKELPAGVKACIHRLADMGVDGVMDRFFVPAIQQAAEGAQHVELVAGRARRHAEVVVKQATLLRDHGFETALAMTHHKNATGLLRNESGFPPHPPCCAVTLVDKERSVYACAPDGHRSLVDGPQAEVATGPQVQVQGGPQLPPEQRPGNASNRAAWVARIGDAAARHIVDAGGDVFDVIPAHGFPDPGFANPCWRNATGLWCIPAFHIIGVSKCGTTDLYRRLSLHPHVASSHNKGPHFWDEGHTFDWYLRLYDVSAAAIARDPGHVVVGDASSNTLTFAGVGVRSSRQPPGGVTLPQVLAALQPGLRMVALLRNPTERLLSAFLYYRHYAVVHGASAEGFHAFATAQVEAFRQACPPGATPGECRSRGYARAEQLTKGLYALFLPDYFAAFPKQQLLILRSEVYGNATEACLRAVVAHLGLEHPGPEAWDRMLAAQRSNTRRRGDGAVEMLPTTRALLDDFYRPYNDDLARLLGDDGYRWHSGVSG